MSDFFAQYRGVETHLVVLEIIGVLFGFLSVWYAKKGNIWVYPTGIISTVLFVYLLWHYVLWGDMLINAYYTAMSIYGWVLWAKNAQDNVITTAIFLVGMWLMAKRKIENWLFWILGDLISVPLYFKKGMLFTSFQYLLFTIIAIMGYIEWKKHLRNERATSSVSPL